MLPTKRNAKHNSVREVEGSFPIHFHYTAGISTEKFFLGLKEKKILGNTCATCNFTYLPPKIFCEDCFAELGNDTYKEVPQTGILESYTEIYYDFRGDKLETPYFLALIKVDETDTMFYHKLIDTENPKIGMKVSAIWNDDRKGSIHDLNGFKGI